MIVYLVYLDIQWKIIVLWTSLFSEWVPIFYLPEIVKFSFGLFVHRSFREWGRHSVVCKWINQQLLLENSGVNSMVFLNQVATVWIGALEAISLDIWPWECSKWMCTVRQKQKYVLKRIHSNVWKYAVKTFSFDVFAVVFVPLVLKLSNNIFLIL